MSKAIPSENILKLRELTKKMCEIPHEKEYEELFKKIKIILEKSKEEIRVLPTTQSKVKYYERMYSIITDILNTIEL